MESTRLELLCALVLAGKASAAETAELAELMALPENEGLAKELLYKAYEAPKDLVDISEEKQQAILKAIYQSDEGTVKRFKLRRGIAAAAAVLIFLSGGLFLYQHKAKAPQTAAIQKQDIAPGGNRAVLTLANGRQISLTDARNGQVASQNQTVINKISDGHLIYKQSTGDNTDIVYNTMATPNGGQYTLTLSDGTVVTLNAASSIKFPVAFSGKDRVVELSGEAYFEVAHNKAKPFKVKTATQEIAVLGTHFNVNAYSDEDAVKTTLLEGSVKITTQNRTALLKPGEQAALKTGSLKISQVNTDQAVAWKNGLFEFQDANLATIMRQLGRWYNVRITYQGQIPAMEFQGEMSRAANASKVLDMLSYAGVHFEINGREIIVKP